MEVQVKRAFKSFFGKKNNTKAEPASNFLQPLVQDSLFYNEHPFISPPPPPLFERNISTARSDQQNLNHSFDHQPPHTI